MLSAPFTFSGTVLLTGASGFVGKEILKTFQLNNINIRPVYRSFFTSDCLTDVYTITDLDSATDWSKALHEVDVVIHAAGRSHVMNDSVLDPYSEYIRVNVDGTLNLARQAAAAGVKRFVFISTIKVNGESTNPGSFFTSDNIPDPQDFYGISKSLAEDKIKQLSQETGMEVTIIRPPMIYGPGVKGNFLTLINLVRNGFPLPLGRVTFNRRSLVGLDNLVDLIKICVVHPKAGNQIFLVSDGVDLSTTDLLKKIGDSLGKPARLINVPVWFISSLALLTGKYLISQRLLCSLQVDMQKTCELLDWKPPVAIEDGLRRAVEYKRHDKSR